MNGIVIALISVDALVFLLGALAHAGVPIRLGLTTWKEPIVVGAAVVEGIGALLLIGALAAIALGIGPSATLTRIALWYCFLGVLWGLVFLALKTVPEARTVSNDFLHIAMLLITFVAFALS